MVNLSIFLSAVEQKLSLLSLVVFNWWECDCAMFPVPTLHNFDIIPPGGNMTGGNILVCHDDDDDDGDDDDDDDDDDDGDDGEGDD